jgi:repressor LexA
MESEIGLRLVKLREKIEKSQEEVAADIPGATQSIISRHERGEIVPGRKWVEKYAAYYGVTMDYLLGRDNAALSGYSVPPAPTIATVPYANIPVYSEVRAGDAILPGEQIDGYKATEWDLVQHDPDNYFWLRVCGNSMVEDGITDKGMILVHRQQEVDDGNVAVVYIADEGCTVKKVKKADGVYVLIPRNRDLEPVIVAAHLVKIIGRVKKAEAMFY